MLERDLTMASRKKGVSTTMFKTMCGRVSKPPVNQTVQNWVSDWTAVEKCRQNKKKHVSNRVDYAKKKRDAKDLYHSKKKVDKKKWYCIVIKFAFIWMYSLYIAYIEVFE